MNSDHISYLKCFTLPLSEVGPFSAARHLRRMDPGATVTKTEFFNHTHVPDMVLEWPGRPRTPRRFIYLRTTSDQRELEDDLQRLPRADRPVLLALGQLSSTRQQGDLPPHPSSSTSLLLDTSALGALQPADDSPGIPQLVSRSVLEGGRGTLDRPATEEFRIRSSRERKPPARENACPPAMLSTPSPRR
ncbi:hypothetical protein [Streptomyces cyaneofuscatus]|uniref:hypothetical protein n=1 Tax=Streptomyces cyaneofuscatus TaxID=66883 RepID=UPI00382828E4